MLLPRKHVSRETKRGVLCVFYGGPVLEASVGRIARKLYESVTGDNPMDDGWFEDALRVAMDRGITLDSMIWEAVRKIVAECEGRRELFPPGAQINGNSSDYHI